VKSLAVGIAAGIIFDATVIRALLVPALMRLLGNANWWMPSWMCTALRLGPREIALPADFGPRQIPEQAVAVAGEVRT
jgi:uncharacterized membrane protein YdfJ with MMPL/SSD domain